MPSAAQPYMQPIQWRHEAAPHLRSFCWCFKEKAGGKLPSAVDGPCKQVGGRAQQVENPHIQAMLSAHTHSTASAGPGGSCVCDRSA